MTKLSSSSYQKQLNRAPVIKNVSHQQKLSTPIFRHLPKYCEHSDHSIGLLWKLFKYRPHCMVDNFEGQCQDNCLNVGGEIQPARSFALIYVAWIITCLLSILCGLGWEPAVTLYDCIVGYPPWR